MKHKLFSYILAAACVAGVFSCNKNAEEDFSLAPGQERDIYLTATMGYTPDTRAVSVSGEAISCTWNEGDQLDLVLNNEVITKLTVTSIFGDKAMLSGKVKGAYPEGTQFTLYYGGSSYYKYYEQDGTAESAGLRGYLKADVTIAEQDNKTLKLSAVTLQHQQAYFELRFRFGPDLIPVKKLRVVNMGPDTTTPDDPNDSTEVAGKIVRSWGMVANPDFSYFGTGENAFIVSSSTNEAPTTVYFAMRDNTEGTGKLTYKFEVTDPSNRTYTAHPKDMGTGPIQNGRYYSGEWILDQKSNGDGAALVVPTGIADLVYNGEQQDLITAGMLKDNVSEKAGVGTEMQYYVRYFEPNATTDMSAPAANDPAWTSTLPQGKEPGTYYIYYQVIGGDFYESIAPAAIAGNPVVIEKRTVSITAPTVITGLKYTGSAQALVNAGTVADKTDPEFFEDGLVMKYFVKSFALDYTPTSDDLAAPSTSATGWVSDVPVGTNAAKYYVWYKVDGNAHYYDYSENNETVLGPILTPIAAAEAVVGNPVPIEGLVYNGVEQQLVLPADASEGCKVYYLVTTDATLVPTANSAASETPYSTGWVLPTDTEPAKRAPKEKNAGTYYVWTKIVEDEGSHNYTDAPGISAAPVVAIIGKADVTITPPTALTTLVYNGAMQNLVATASGTTHPDGAVTYLNSENLPQSALENDDFPATLKYMVTESTTPPTDWTGATTYPEYPQAKNGGTYRIWLKVEGSRNFKDQIYASGVQVTIGKADVTITPPTALNNLKYNGSMQNLVATASGTTHPDGSVTYTNSQSNQQSALENDDFPATLKYKVTSTETAPTNWTDDTTTYPIYPQAKNGGDYYIWLKVEGSRNFNAMTYATSVPVTIGPAAITTNPPTLASPWTYNATAHNLITGAATVNYSTTGSGTASATADDYPATVYYTYRTDSSTPAADDSGWNTTFLSVSNAATYTVWYKVTGSRNFESLAPTSVGSILVSPKNPTYTAPTATNPVYNGNPQNLVSALTITEPTSGMSIEYKLGTDGSWVTAIPVATAVGSYTVFYRATSSNSNYNSISETSVQASITPKSPTLSSTPTVVASDLTYNAAAQSLLSAEATLATEYTDGGCSLRYQVTTTNTAPETPAKDATIGGEWKTDIADIKGENAGTYYIWTLIVGGANYNNVVCDAVTKAIGKAPSSATVTAVSSLTYDEAVHELVTCTDVVGGEVKYKVTTTDSETAPTEGDWATDIPTATNAGTYYVWYMIEGDTNHSDKAATKVSVTIAQATATVTLSDDTLSFESTDPVNSSKEISVTTNVVVNPENLTFEYSEPNKAEATISGTNAVTVTRKTTEAVSSLTITVKAKDSNHTEASATCTVTMAASS